MPLVDDNVEPDSANASAWAPPAAAPTCAGRCAGPEEERPVYAFGTVRALFPSLSIEKEFLQALPETTPQPFDIRDESALLRLNRSIGLAGLLYPVLANPANAHIAREMVWIFSDVEGTDRFELEAPSESELAWFIQALQPVSTGPQQLVLVGRRSRDSTQPAPSLESARRARVRVTQLSIPGVLQVPGAAELFAMASGVTANPSDGREWRALNYAVLNSATLYAQMRQLAAANPALELACITPDLSAGPDPHLRCRVVYTFQSAAGARSRWYSMVDVAGEFPYLVFEWRKFTSY